MHEIKEGSHVVVKSYPVKEMPSVDAKPVRYGKYEFIGMGMMAGTRRLYFGTCSECKERIIFASEHKNYCSNCGAKMVLKEDG